MAGVTLATRELKNKATGLDLAVPNYEEVPGAFGGTIGGSVLYHIIVVTKLFYFKTPGKHKESDVVQFMIPHKYHVFEELYHKLSQKFPSVVFPPLPKKALLISESVVNERRRFMETVLQQIARTPKLACSSLLLEFLGARRGAADELKLEDTKISETKDLKEEEVDDEVDLFAAADVRGEQEGQDLQDDAENEDLFTTTKAVSAGTKPGQRSVFRLDDEHDTKIDDLFIPTGALPKNLEKGATQDDEDNSDLLRVDDNLDELFSKPKKPSKPEKPQKPPKPTATKPPLKPRPKPELKPKPVPEMTFQESQGGEDDLLKVSEGEKLTGVVNVPNKEKTKQPADEDLFAAARKKSGSLRKASHEEDTLDDIFNISAKSPFAATEDDDDLFKNLGPSQVADMNVDDISQYIQQNLSGSTKENLKLF